MTLKEKALEVQAAGKGGDIHLIHVNDEELQIIKQALKHSGVVNEDTGLLSFNTKPAAPASPPTHPSDAAHYPDGSYVSVQSGSGYAWQWQPGGSYSVSPAGSSSSSYSGGLSMPPNPVGYTTDRDGKDFNVLDASGNVVATYNSSNAAQGHITNMQSTYTAALGDNRTMQMMEAYGAMGMAQARQAYEMSVMASERVEQKMPAWRDQALTAAGEDTPWLNRMITREFESALDLLYPRWRTDIVEAGGDAQADSVTITDRFRREVMPKVLDAADEMGMQAIANSSALLRGEIPADVAAQIKRNAAEIGNQIGVRGQAQGNIVARDLGLTSLQLMEAGLGQSQAALGLSAQAYSNVNQTLQAPVTTGANLTNLLSAYRAPITDPAALYNNYLGIISGQGAISPNAVLQTTAQVGTQFSQMGQNQGQFSSQLQQQSYWNGMNYNLQQQAIKQAGRADTFGQVMGGIGALGQAAGGAAAAYTAFSDRRLKRNIQQIGVVRGINIYEWDYVWGAHSAGVMADEVPHAAFMTPSGYYAVDYSKVFV